MRHSASWVRAAGLLCVIGTAAGCGGLAAPGDPRLADTTPPLVAGAQPTAGAIGVAGDASITVTFNEAMDPASATGQVTVSSADSLSLNWIDTRTLSITHAPVWGAGVQIQVTLGTGFADAAGNHLAAAYAFSFFTQTSAVLLLATDPLDAATGVNRSANVRLQFSVAMDAASIAAGVSIHDVTDAMEFPFTVDTSGPDNWATLNINDDLPAATTVIVALSPSVHAYGSPGNTLGTEVNFSFTTGAAVDTSPPSILSIEPANGTTVSAGIGMLRITFSEPVNPSTFHPTSWNAEMATLFFSAAIDPVWSANNTVMTVPLPNPLPPGLPMAIVVSGFEDASGNAQPAPYTWAVTVAGTADYYPMLDGLELVFAGTWQRGLTGNPEPVESGVTTDYRKLEQQSNGTFHFARYNDPDFTPPGSEWDVYSKTANAFRWLGFTNTQNGQTVQEVFFDSPLTLLPLPVAAGTWTSSTTVTIPNEGSYSAQLAGRVIGQENIPIPDSGGMSGLYYKNVWKVARTLTVTFNAGWVMTQADTTWYSPTLGVVRTHRREDQAANNTEPARWYWSGTDRVLGSGTSAR